MSIVRQFVLLSSMSASTLAGMFGSPEQVLVIAATGALLMLLTESGERA